MHTRLFDSPMTLNDRPNASRRRITYVVDVACDTNTPIRNTLLIGRELCIHISTIHNMDKH